MNNEELEVSLRTDIESYVGGILAEMKREAADFQSRIDAELEKHRSQLNEAFQDFSSRLRADGTIDQGFRESIVEHLRLAKDNGAQITAHAFAEAESMRRSETAHLGFSDIRDAIREISEQTSQSAILKSLVRHAERFTSRGAFFIVRNEQFVGWQAFGQEVGTADNVIRHVSMPCSAKTILSESCRSLKSVTRRADDKSEDKLFLDVLGFGRPDAMLALPLIARGRGVAVLYVDSGASGNQFNAEALETLLCVASLTVELLASNQTAHPHVPAAASAAEQPAVTRHESQAATTQWPAADTSLSSEVEENVAVTETYSADEYQTAYEEPAADHPQPTFSSDQHVSSDFEVNGSAQDKEVVAEDVPTPAYEAVPDAVEYVAEPEFETTQYAKAAEEVPTAEPEVERFDTYAEPVAAVEYQPVEEVTPQITKSDFAFETNSGGSYSTQPSVAFSETAPVAETVVNGNGNGNGHSVATIETSTVGVVNGAPKTSGYRKRSIDLPIEVSDDERADHVKARRFARLLVSEINLYNEQRVKEGRSSGDLYGRLREAIDRSREMYQQRVQQPVSSRFDYFHYEIVNGLAEGDEARLGPNYPGPTVR